MQSDETRAPADVPLPPFDVFATTLSPYSILVRWKAPHHQGAPIEQYVPAWPVHSMRLRCTGFGPLQRLSVGSRCEVLSWRAWEYRGGVGDGLGAK